MFSTRKKYSRLHLAQNLTQRPFYAVKMHDKTKNPQTILHNWNTIMTKVSFTLTATQKQHLERSLADLADMTPQFFKQSAKDALQQAGIVPSVSTGSQLASMLGSLEVEQIVLNDPMAFFVDMFVKAEELANTPGDNTPTDITLNLDVETAQELQFMLLSFTGALKSIEPQKDDLPIDGACKTITKAIQEAIPQAPTRIGPVSITFDDGTTASLGR